MPALSVSRAPPYPISDSATKQLLLSMQLYIERPEASPTKRDKRFVLSRRTAIRMAAVPVHRPHPSPQYSAPVRTHTGSVRDSRIVFFTTHCYSYGRNPSPQGTSSAPPQYNAPVRTHTGSARYSRIVRFKTHCHSYGSCASAQGTSSAPPQYSIHVRTHTGSVRDSRM